MNWGRIAYAILFLLAILAGSSGTARAGITVTAVGGINQHRTDLATILTAVTGTQVTIAANGVMSIADGGNACATILRNAINAPQAVTLNVGRNLDGVLMGGFHGTDGTTHTKSTGTQDIDLDDIDKLGDNNTTGTQTRGAILMHEIWEVIISLRDQIPYDDYTDAQGHTQDGAHKKAIEDCENGYYSAMVPPVMLPTAKMCGDGVARDLGGGNFKLYSHYKSGGGVQTEGWSCLPIQINGTKFQATGPPTFVPGAQPPANSPEPSLSLPGVAPGPMEGFACLSSPAFGIPALSDVGAMVMLLSLLTAAGFLLRRRAGGW